MLPSFIKKPDEKKSGLSDKKPGEKEVRKKKEKLKLSDPENPGPIQLASPGEHVHITLSLLLKKLKLSKKKCEKYFLSDSQKKKGAKNGFRLQKRVPKKKIFVRKNKRQKKVRKISVRLKKGKKKRFLSSVKKEKNNAKNYFCPIQKNPSSVPKKKPRSKKSAKKNSGRLKRSAKKEFPSYVKKEKISTTYKITSVSVIRP